MRFYFTVWRIAAAFVLLRSRHRTLEARKEMGRSIAQRVGEGAEELALSFLLSCLDMMHDCGKPSLS